jgi:hypothetical protein
MHSENDAMIEEWALRHRFDELTDEQQAGVITALGSRDSYERLHVALRATRVTLEREVLAARPDPATALRLHAALRSRSASHRSAGRAGASRVIAAVLGWRIPAYQALAGVVAIATLLLVVRPVDEVRVPVVRREIVTVPVRDTIVITREAPEQRVTTDATMIAAAHPGQAAAQRVERPKHAERSRNGDRSDERADAVGSGVRQRARKDSMIAKPDDVRPNRFVGLDNIPMLAQQRRGVTIAEDTSYRRFTFAVN